MALQGTCNDSESLLKLVVCSRNLSFAPYYDRYVVGHPTIYVLMMVRGVVWLLFLVIRWSLKSVTTRFASMRGCSIIAVLQHAGNSDTMLPLSVELQSPGQPLGSHMQHCWVLHYTGGIHT